MENIRQKLKLFNYRPIVLVFLGLIFGILVKNFVQSKTLITIIGIIVVVGVLLFYSILHKKFKYCVIIGITFILGFGVYGLYINTRTHNVPDMINKTAVATIERIVTYDSYISLLIKDIKVDEQKLDYNATLHYYNTKQAGYIKLAVGDKVSFIITKQSEPNKIDEEGLPHTYNYKNDIGTILKTNEISIIENNESVRSSILIKIRNNLRNGLNNLNGEMIYSAMFGDKTYLNNDLYNAYKGSGVAHLLAVSGLHVGLVVAILNWLMKKCRVRGWWRVGLIAILLICYAYLCGFSYSIIRASIMALVLMIAPLLFSEYDLLNSICFAGVLILLIEPVALFDLSAQLSFSCVFGIALLLPIFQKWFRKVPITNSIKDGFSISLATIISTAPFMAYYFGYLQPISLISNIIILPIFSILFSITFILAIISLVLPFVSYLLIFINPLFEWTNWAIISIANSVKAITVININYLSIILFFVMLVFMSKFNLKKGSNKLAICSICLMTLALQIAVV